MFYITFFTTFIHDNMLWNLKFFLQLLSRTISCDMWSICSPGRVSDPGKSPHGTAHQRLPNSPFQEKVIFCLCFCLSFCWWSYSTSSSDEWSSILAKSRKSCAWGCKDLFKIWYSIYHKIKIWMEMKGIFMQLNVKIKRL